MFSHIMRRFSVVSRENVKFENSKKKIEKLRERKRAENLIFAMREKYLSSS